MLYVDVKTSGTSVSLIYNAILSIFSEKIKAKVQEQLQNMAHEMFDNNMDEFLYEYREQQ
jgi:hypothetical protein